MYLLYGKCLFAYRKFSQILYTNAIGSKPNPETTMFPMQSNFTFNIVFFKKELIFLKKKGKLIHPYFRLKAVLSLHLTYVGIASLLFSELHSAGKHL